MHVVIDLFGTGDVVEESCSDDHEEEKLETEKKRKAFIEELMKRAPRPQVIPIKQ